MNFVKFVSIIMLFMTDPLEEVVHVEFAYFMNLVLGCCKLFFLRKVVMNFWNDDYEILIKQV
jgi:hypothetical protein